MLHAMSSYESAANWNRQNPPGTCVRLTLRDGGVLEARTRSYATQWGGFAVVALEDRSGLFTAAALQPVGAQPDGHRHGHDSIESSEA